jgi:predicted kinase
MAKISKKALLLKLLEETVENKKLTTKQEPLFIVSFVGLTGVGKSSVAYLLKEKSKLPLFSHDDIRDFLERHEQDKTKRALVEWLSVERATYLIREGISFILDGDVISYYKTLEKRLKQYNGRLLLNNVICDLDVVIDRLKKRHYGEKQVFGNVNYSITDFNSYFQRRFLHSQGEYPRKFFITVNNTHDSEGQVDELWFKMKMWIKKEKLGLT